jgi:hypothetical protein
MIDRPALLADLKRLVVSVQDHLRTRATSADVPDIGRRLAAEYARATRSPPSPARPTSSAR